MISLGTAFVVVSLLVGCGKKKEEKVEKRPDRLMEEAQFDQMSPEEAMLFDEDFKDFEEFADQFAFLDEGEDQTSMGSDSAVDAKFAFADDEVEDVSSKFQNIQFGFNSDALSKNQLEVLHKNIEEAQEAIEEGKNIEVHAYRCPMGEATFNMALSQRTANNVKKAMVEHGIPAERITAMGDGQENPVVADDDPTCNRTERIKRLAPNRRAVILAV